MVIIRKKPKETASEKEARLQKDKDLAMGIQDQYQARGFEFVSWVQDHKLLVGLAIAAMVLGGALLGAYFYYQKLSAEKASSTYLEVINSIDGIARTSEEDVAKWQKAQASLVELAKESSSGVGILAKLYGAHLALQNNDAKTAVELYQEALKGINASDPLYSLALVGLGYAREKNGDVKGARESFESLIELKNNLGKDLALWEAARLSNSLNESERAKKNLARLLEEYPASVYEKDAQSLKDTLK